MSTHKFIFFFMM